VPDLIDRDRRDVKGLFEEAIEEHPAVSRATTVEAHLTR